MTWYKWPVLISPSTGSCVDIRAANTTCDDLDVYIVVSKCFWLELNGWNESLYLWGSAVVVDSLPQIALGDSTRLRTEPRNLQKCLDTWRLTRVEGALIHTQEEHFPTNTRDTCMKHRRSSQGNGCH